MFKTRFISILALLMVAVTGAWAEDYYNVTFSGFDVPALNTTVTTTLPKDFTAGEQGHKFSAWNIYDDGNTLSNVTVSGGNGKVSSSIYNDDFLKITVSGAFDGNATIHVSGVRDGGGGFEADITVTCVSANEAFDVTYDANGGSGAPSAQEKRKDTDLTLSSDVPTRTGYTFAGWNTAQDGSGDSYAPGATYTANADVTLYAQWTAPAASTYTVTLKEGTDDATSWTIAPAEATTTGVAQGTEVTATYSGTKKVKSVKAKKAAPANVPVESITLNKTATEITVGQTETLSVTEVLPANATDPTYTWKTSDETKATVDQDGKVTAVAAGTVNIYAEANDGSGVTAICAVTVNPAFNFDKQDWSLVESAPANFISVSQTDAKAAADAEKTRANAPGYVCIYAYENGEYKWIDSHGRTGQSSSIMDIANGDAWDEVYECEDAGDSNSIWFTVSPTASL